MYITEFDEAIGMLYLIYIVYYTFKYYCILGTLSFVTVESHFSLSELVATPRIDFSPHAR